MSTLPRLIALVSNLSRTDDAPRELELATLQEVASAARAHAGIRRCFVGNGWNEELGGLAHVGANWRQAGAELQALLAQVSSELRGLVRRGFRI
jgi:hypothetical protein